LQTLFFFELSGELDNMPLAEAVRTVKTESEDNCRISSFGPGYLIMSFPEECLNGITDRISLTHSIGRYLGSCDPEDVSSLEGSELPNGTFAIHAKRFRGMMKEVDSQNLIRKIGNIYSRDRDVDLKHPDNVVRIQMCDRVHVYLEQWTGNPEDARHRKVSERPFFSPISLHPKYARALINLTGVRKGGTVLDPFCGTGGIAIEAASMGMKSLVSDFDVKMVDGTRENMEFYGLDLEDFGTSDIGDIPQLFSEVDAIATDPPYGRSTRTEGEPVDQIYARALEVFPKVLKADGYAGVVLPHTMNGGPMLLENVYEQYVHGSLSRFYHVFRSVQ